MANPSCERWGSIRRTRRASSPPPEPLCAEARRNSSGARPCPEAGLATFKLLTAAYTPDRALVRTIGLVELPDWALVRTIAHIGKGLSSCAGGPLFAPI